MIHRLPPWRSEAGTTRLSSGSLRLGRAILLLGCIASVSVAQGNLVRNGGFGGPDHADLPDHWLLRGRGEWELVRSATEAHRGSNCLRMHATNAAPVTVYPDCRVRVRVLRELTVSVWTRGKGRLTIVGYLYSGKRNGLRSLVQAKPVDHDGWEQQTIDIVIPKRAPSSRTGRDEPVAELCLGLRVDGGAVWVDDVRMAWKQAASTARQTVRPDDDRVPLGAMVVTIPRVTTAPVIDGRMEQGEWGRAACVTGFRGMDGAMAREQPLVYVCYDETRLYVAFQSLHQGRIVRESTPARDTDIAHNDIACADAIELWLAPDDKRWFQFFGLPAGGFLDRSKDASFTWDGTWEYASTVEDSGETAGGVLMFGKETWTAELCLRFDSLGVSAPKQGDEWRINFCRDLSAKRRTRSGSPRSPAESTTWSDLLLGGGTGSFENPDAFGYARFSRESPVVQVRAFGDLANGLLDVRGRVHGATGDRVDVNAVAALRGGAASGKVVVEKHLSLPLPASAAKELSLREPIKVRGATDMQLTVTARDQQRGKLLTRMSVPFTCQTSFRLRPVLVYVKGFVDVHVDTARVPDLPEAFRVVVEIPQAGISERADLSLTTPATIVRLGISELKAGDYTVRGTLLDAAGKTLAAGTEPLLIPERPAWLGNTIGVSEEAPSPWTSVKVEGQRVSITQREYHLADSGWPGQIRSLGETMLTGPVSLKAMADGKLVSWAFEPMKRTAQRPREVDFEIKGVGGPLHMEGDLRAEFDGFSLLRFRIRPRRPVNLTSLVLEFPLRRDMALYALARRVKPPEKYCWVSLYENTFKSAKRSEA